MLAPGGTEGSSVGDFSVGGNFALNTGAILALQMTGLGVGNVDLLNVIGSATLNGAMSLLTSLGISPSIGNQFTVLTATDGVTGEFDATDLPALDDGLAWAVHYEATSVLLEVIAGLPGDYNNGGTVDAADYTVWRDHLDQSFTLNNENPTAATPGVVDAEDYNFWKSSFGQTLGSG